MSLGTIEAVYGRLKEQTVRDMKKFCWGYLKRLPRLGAKPGQYDYMPTQIYAQHAGSMEILI